jgi:hypothetical protein
VTGRRATFVHVSPEEYVSIWGKDFGDEMVAMFKSFEPEKDWAKPYRPDVVTAEDLGIKKEELVGLRETLEREKHRL